MDNGGISSYLANAYGFEGNLLTRMMRVIKSNEDFEDLDIFILLNEGFHRGSLNTVCAYERHIVKQRKSLYEKSAKVFATLSDNEKIELFNDLFVGEFSDSLPHSIDELLNIRKMSVRTLFEHMFIYRMEYSARTSFNLILHEI